ncbi:MAG TPA: GMC family oxidoreductase N-terminal domain-containing protein, partial [Polyangiaceae bacterium]|nr:GMC family oxidoreductase N-terminal domain-containing protein [Polyangiaceae bacterium]
MPYTPPPGFASFPDESLPDGAVVDGAKLTADVEDVFDYVVVGSGAAGAVAAHVLSASGARVALVEEGAWVRTRQFGERIYDAFRWMFRDAGMQVIEGRAYIPLLQGRCVGGSTVVNSAIAHRTPEDVLDEWSRGFGLGGAVTAKALEPHFEALERELHARATADDALGTNDRRFLDEAQVHGLAARRTHRYERGCRGAGRCMTGCPNAAKQGMNVTYVPWSLALGARLYCACRVEKVLIDEGRATGVLARGAVGDAPGLGGRVVRLHARRGVLVAASAVQTPNLLRRSGLRSRALGNHFMCHPGYGIGGLFADPVADGLGATQGAEITALRRTDRVKFETIALQPELAAVRIPGVGHEFMERFELFSNFAQWAMVVRAESEGTVRPAWGGGDKVRWSPSRADMERAVKGAALLARMMFEAGAREVWTGLYGVSHAIRSVDAVREIEALPPDPRVFSFIASHLFGGARMGLDPRASVVGTDFEAHEAKGLYVVDSSVF